VVIAVGDSVRIGSKPKAWNVVELVERTDAAGGKYLMAVLSDGKSERVEETTRLRKMGGTS
jgi:hypothetical protein